VLCVGFSLGDVVVLGTVLCVGLSLGVVLDDGVGLTVGVLFVSVVSCTSFIALLFEATTVSPVTEINLTSLSISLFLFVIFP
jgi:hypothetical protein